MGSGPRRKQNCYDASRRKRLGKRKAANNGIIKYELSLMIDRLEREDLEDRIFLVRDFREFNSKDDRFEAIVVPRSRKSRTFESEDDDEQDTDYLQYAKEKLRDGRGCLIRDEYVDTGDSIEVPELCVELICKDNTNVDVRSLHESNVVGD